MARCSKVQVAFVLVAVTSCVLGVMGAEIGVERRDPQPAASDKDVKVDVDQETHVRDKRRLPDPGFVIPATPMGFTKKLSDQARTLDSQVSASAPISSTPSEKPQQQQQQQQQANRKVSMGSGRSGDSLAQSSDSLQKIVSSSSGRGREDHVRALKSFLDQTRKLGVPDDQALKLLDKELAKAKLQHGSPHVSQRPVYHATPLKPYGALLNFNQAPYEKHQLKGMKPIKEQQNDIPPPTNPLVIESDRQHLTGSVPGKHTEAVSIPSGPLPVSVPVQLDPVHIQQTAQAQKLNAESVQYAAPQAYTAPQTYTAAIPQTSHQTVALSLPVHSVQHSAQHSYQAPLAYQGHAYQQIDSQQALQSLDHSAVLQAAQQTVTSDDHVQTSASLEGPISYPTHEQHTQQQHIQSYSPVQIQEVQQPVYVYQQEDAKIAPPQAEVHVELPSTVVTKQEVGQEHVGLYSDKEDHVEEYASQYRFGYRVRDDHAGNDFGHAETREGKMTKGEYFVTLPDGRLQQVKYWADPTGYHAHVSYTNHATHAAPVSAHPEHPSSHGPVHQ